MDASVPSHSELLDVLKDAVQEVFSLMVSTFREATVRQLPSPDSIEVEGDAGAPERIQMDSEATVGFQGALDGAVILRCTAEGAMDIARSFLMLDESEALDVEEITDALGECANMVTGVLKTKGLDPHGEFQLGLPQVNEREASTVGTSRGVLAYRLTQGMISLEIWLDD